MADKRKPQRTYWIALVFVLPVFYVLSTGPVFKLFESFSPIPHWVEESLTMFYLPLTWLYEQNELAEAFLDWYFEIWGAG